MVKVSVTRASHKRRLHENNINYSAKKANVTVTKDLVLQYNKLKSLSKDCNTNFLYSSF